MKWDFTPDEVVRGEVAYGLLDFRHDLYQEVATNLGEEDGALQARFDLIYDLCYWIATGREFEDFIKTIGTEPALDEPFLATIKEYMAENITMLGAILQRMIMEGVEQGLPVEEAVDQAARQHQEQVEASSSLQVAGSGAH
jgi:hypothetical protein